jgi:heat shock protein HslJ
MMLVRTLAAVVGVTLAVFAGVAAGLTPFPLTNTVWAWHATIGDDGARAPVSSPQRYTIQLLPDGTVRVRADCNPGGGRYEATDVDLRFGPIKTTKKGCPAGSRDREFLEALSRVDAYRFEGIELVLTTAGSGRMMRFKPAAAD